MHHRLLSPIRAALFAVVAVACVAVPAAMALPGHMEMAVQADAGRPDHGHPSPDGHRHTRTCCDLCIVACGTAVTPLSGVTWPARPLHPAIVPAVLTVGNRPPATHPHRQPLAIGPPSLRA